MPIGTDNGDIANRTRQACALCIVEAAATGTVRCQRRCQRMKATGSKPAGQGYSTGGERFECGPFLGVASGSYPVKYQYSKNWQGLKNVNPPTTVNDRTIIMFRIMLLLIPVYQILYRVIPYCICMTVNHFVRFITDLSKFYTFLTEP